MWAGIGQDVANARITAQGSKPAAKSISETIAANSIWKTEQGEKSRALEK